MNKDFEYKGYIGSIDFSVEDKIFYGKVLGIRALISYEGKNGEELHVGRAQKQLDLKGTHAVHLPLRQGENRRRQASQRPLQDGRRNPRRPLPVQQLSLVDCIL